MRAAELVRDNPLPYDAVVLDEAQDLAQGEWELVRAIAKDGPLWAFGDEGQGFWKERREIPADIRPFVYLLQKPYRCPEKLASFADRYRQNAPPAKEPPAPFEELTVLTVPGDSLEAGCAVAIEKLVEEGIRLDQIAVLSLAGQGRAVLGTASRMGDYEVVQADEDGAGGKLIAETFLRFKGLERPWIIVTELGLAATNYEIRMHIALTRATVGCIVVATQGDIDRDARLRAIHRG